MFSNNPPPKVAKSMYFSSNMSYIGEISPFSLQKVVFGATWLRVFGEILLISPQNHIYCCVPLNHCIKLKFYAFCVFAVANYVFCGIFITKCQIPCYMYCPAFMFNYKCVLLQRTPICLLWCSLKAIFSCFVPHHALLHVSCILLVCKFNANKQIN